MDNLLLVLPVLIFSVVVHEYAHGWMALRQGDQTALMLGRLTLNPVPHIDPIGSLLVPGMLALLPGGLIFGWAKPVPVNPRNFRNYRRGDILVSLAGVAANLLIAIACIVLLVIMVYSMGLPQPGTIWDTVSRMLRYGVLLNIVLIVFNLLPIPPLDGSHVMYHLLPPQLGLRYRQLGQYGFLILFALLFLTGFRFISFPVLYLTSILASVSGLPLRWLLSI
jgi:Zn-dependent protease